MSGLDSQSGPEPRAQPANAAGEIGAGLERVQVALDRQAMRDGLLDDHRVGGEDLAELVGDPARVDRVRVFERQRLFPPFSLSIRETAAPLFAPSRNLGISFLHSLSQS